MKKLWAWLLFIAAVLLYSPLLLTTERFALHDKPGSWTQELIESRDPTAQELWNLSQSYMTDAWECESRIHTMADGRMLVARGPDGCCCIRKSRCR